MEIEEGFIASSPAEEGVEDPTNSANSSDFMEHSGDMETDEQEQQQQSPKNSVSTDSMMNPSIINTAAGIINSPAHISQESGILSNNKNNAESTTPATITATTTITTSSNNNVAGNDINEMTLMVPRTSNLSKSSSTILIPASLAAILNAELNDDDPDEMNENPSEGDDSDFLNIANASSKIDNDENVDDEDVDVRKNVREIGETSRAGHDLDLNQENLATLAAVSTGNLAPLMDIATPSSLHDENQSQASSTSTSEITSTLLTLSNATVAPSTTAAVSETMATATIAQQMSLSSSSPVLQKPLTSSMDSTANESMDIDKSLQGVEATKGNSSTITTPSVTSSIGSIAAVATSSSGPITTPVAVPVSVPVVVAVTESDANASNANNILPSPLMAVTSNITPIKSTPPLITAISDGSAGPKSVQAVGTVTPTTAATNISALSGTTDSTVTPMEGKTTMQQQQQQQHQQQQRQSPSSSTSSSSSAAITSTPISAGNNSSSNNSSSNNSNDDGEWHTVGIFQGLNATVNSYIDRRVWSSANLNLTSNELPDLSEFPRINLEPGTAYRFRIRAINTVGTSDWSEISSFKTCLPGYPGAPSAIKISKSTEGAHLTWEPPSSCMDSNEIVEYSVYLAVKPSKDKDPKTQQQQQQRAAQLAFVRVYVGAANQCTVSHNSLGVAHVDCTNKPAIIFRIAARNEKGYGPATQVRWLQETVQSALSPGSAAVASLTASAGGGSGGSGHSSGASTPHLTPSTRIKPEILGSSPPTKRYKANGGNRVLAPPAASDN